MLSWRWRRRLELPDLHIYRELVTDLNLETQRTPPLGERGTIRGMSYKYKKHTLVGWLFFMRSYRIVRLGAKANTSVPIWLVPGKEEHDKHFFGLRAIFLRSIARQSSSKDANMKRNTAGTPNMLHASIMALERLSQSPSFGGGSRSVPFRVCPAAGGGMTLIFLRLAFLFPQGYGALPQRPFPHPPAGWPA